MNLSFLDKLNPEQKQAVLTTDGPLLIVAVAGSGKTTVLINRVAYLVEQGINPESILLITFTVKAAQNMKNRAMKLANKDCGKVYASTFHSFYADMLRKYGRNIDIDPNFSIITGGDVNDSIEYVLNSKKELSEKPGFPPIAAISSLYSISINTNTSIKSLVRINPNLFEFSKDLEVLYDEWVKYKKSKNIFTYDDLMLAMAELVKNDKARQAIQNKFKYIMVDEYQDINALQQQILDYIVGPDRNFAVVGDDYQSIYRFRGSDVKYITEFENNNPDATTITIDTNYRSTEEILSFVNDIMHKKADFGIQKDMHGINRHGDPVQIIKVEDEDDESYCLLNKIIDSYENKEPLNETAVLARSGKETVRLELLLAKNNIPFDKRGGKKFIEEDCIIDMIALMNIISNPINQIGWFRSLKILPNIGNVNATKICEFYQDKDFLIKDQWKSHKYYEWLKKLNVLYNELYSLGYKEAFDRLLGFYCEVRQYQIDTMKTKTESNRTKRQEELNADKELLEILAEIKDDYNSFTQLLDALSFGKNDTEDSDGVIISTIHSAKGLEFNNVYIMNVIDERFPGMAKTKDDIDEELRCFYVALTRAKNNLTLIVPNYITNRGEQVETTISSFIDESLNYAQIQEYSKYDILHRMTLQFELVPEPLFGKNLRSKLTSQDWTKISKSVRKYCRCSICKQKYPEEELEAHEVWSYNDIAGEQKLIDIIPVCKLCHNTIHIGSGSIRYDINVLRDHYCKINGVSLEEELKIEEEAFKTWNKRNTIEWTQTTPQSIINRYLYTNTAVETYKKQFSDTKTENVSIEKIYIKVSYSEKDEAKALGARWDPIKKSWYYTSKNNPEQFKKWKKE